MSFFTTHFQKRITTTLESITSSKPLGRHDTDKLWLHLNKLQALTQVQIDHIHYKGQANSLDESVTIRNRGDMMINIGNWRIQAGLPSQVYMFPEDTLLRPQESLDIKTAGNTGHSFRSSQPIWNNKGDTGTLLDDEDQLISALSYGICASKKVIISHINVDGQEHRSEGDEYVEVSNVSSEDVMLSGSRLVSDNNTNTFVFPEHAKLEAYTSFRVYTNKSDLEHNEFSFNSRKAIWNNTSGGCTLFNYLDQKISHYHY